MSGNCDEALTKLYFYLDSEMSASELEQIRVHLGDCSPCGGVFDFEQRLREVVRDRLAEEVPPAALDRFREALRLACDE